MNKITIVILNYINHWDTIECVESIFKMEYEFEGIIIVDNNSENNSIHVLNRKYKNNKKIIIVKSRKNYGFAKGNNIGIHIARKKFCTDFVLVVNNDTIFTQRDYLKKLMNQYVSGIGILGSEIRLENNIIQKEIVYDISFQGTFKSFYDLSVKKIKKDVWLFMVPEAKEKELVKVLHGCVLLFTPDFFEHYRGFYDKTFLYLEEPILYFMCKKYGMRQLYINNTYIFHKGNGSSKLSFDDYMNVRKDYIRQSYKYLIWWIIKDNIRKIIKQLLKIEDNAVVYESITDIKNKI